MYTYNVHMYVYCSSYIITCLLTTEMLHRKSYAYNESRRMTCMHNVWQHRTYIHIRTFLTYTFLYVHILQMHLQATFFHHKPPEANKLYKFLAMFIYV